MTRRAILGVAILLTWAVLLGWHARREYVQPEVTRLADAARSLAPGTNFFSVRMGGQAIGMSSSRLDTIPDGFILEEVLDLELLASGREGRIAARTRVELTPTLRMSRFSFSLDGPDGRFDAEGSVAGDSLLLVRVRAGSTLEHLDFRVEEAPLVASALPIRVALGGELRTGRTVRLPVFDPSTLGTRTVEVEVLEHDSILLPDSAQLDPSTGRWVTSSQSSVSAWRVRERYDGLSVESWIDEDGRLIRSTSAMGFSLERTDFELANQAWNESRAAGSSATSSRDVILQTAIASNRELEEAAEHGELRFVLSGVDLEDFDLEGGRQEVRGDTLVVRRESWDEIEPGFRLPYPRMDLRGALEPEPLIQSGDDRIRREALRAVGSADSDPVLVAERLTHAVYGMLDKEISFSLPSALQVLESRRGDCTEHTVLYVAMARSLGLPARAAVGLVYLDGAFYYHAWPEVWLGEWVAVDPTFGTAPADAAHLRFMTGSVARQVEIARLIGNLGIEVLE